MKEKYNVDEIEKLINEKMRVIDNRTNERVEKLSEGEKVMGKYEDFKEVEGRYGKNIILKLDSISIYLPLRAKNLLEKLGKGEKIEIVRGRDEVRRSKRGKYIKSVYYILRNENNNVVAYKV